MDFWVIIFYEYLMYYSLIRWFSADFGFCPLVDIETRTVKELASTEVKVKVVAEKPPSFIYTYLGDEVVRKFFTYPAPPLPRTILTILCARRRPNDWRATAVSSRSSKSRLATTSAAFPFSDLTGTIRTLEDAWWCTIPT